MEDKLKLFIFDMDGVILDSEPLHENSIIRLFDQFNINNVIDFNEYVGVSNQKLWKDVLEKVNISHTAEEIEKMQNEYTLKNMKALKMNESDGLVELLNKLSELNIKTAVATSSNRYFVEEVLKYLNILDCFDYIVTCDDVENCKPFPDIYLKVLEISNIDASNVIAIEDSKNGTIAADSAGVRCIGYINPTSGEQEFYNTICEVDNLNNVIDIITKI